MGMLKGYRRRYVQGVDSSVCFGQGPGVTTYSGLMGVAKGCMVFTARTRVLIAVFALGRSYKREL